MEGVTAWYVILSISFFVIALLMRFSTYTFLVRQSRWLPEKASRAANSVFIALVVVGAVILLGKALFFSH
ncbi:MAG: hypothetical protein K2X27_01605 [Candidatus Obscuribacterales bacterium]|nr:hypothetical protein [Candidatus Obscuribacterales bacterium]